VPDEARQLARDLRIRELRTRELRKALNRNAAEKTTSPIIRAAEPSFCAALH
jgi:hypothetical protein